MDDQARRERTTAELKRLPWAKGLDEATIIEMVEVGEFVQLQDGDVVHRADESLTAIVFVISGRLRANVHDLFGNQVLERNLTRGSVFGLFSIAEPEHANTDVVTTEPSTVLRLAIKSLLRLTSKHSDLQMSLYRLAGHLARQIVMVDRTKSQPSVVGVVHQSAASRRLTPELVRRLMQIEEPPCVGTDDPNWQPIEGVPVRQLYENGQLISEVERQALLKEWSELGRIFIDLDANRGMDPLVRVMCFADTILWCVRPTEIDAAQTMIGALEEQVPLWRDKIRLVWLLDGETSVAPYSPELSALVEQDFKLSFTEPKQNHGNLLRLGVERIVHHLRGVQIGLALGGGAARGMAHLGVLKVLEEHGIFVDMIAGTSAGAMTGTLYASGMSVAHAVESFKNDLRLPWLFRHLPGGGYWYLLYKYRRGQFDGMLRRHLGEARLEQLPIPMLTLTVDLVSGGQVVRESGDATRGVLESINLPGLSRPLIRDGEALVDGGLVNNIPADVLVSKGCNFVLASSVTAKLEREFVGIRADQPTAQHETASMLKVIMRGHLVQSFNMNSVGVQPADFVIAPDVTAFDLSAFERTDEMAEVGERTTREEIAKIKQLLAKLDPQLFSE